MANKDLFGNDIPNDKKTNDTFNSSKVICENCMDFDSKNNTCTIRYLIHKDESKSPMPRKPKQKGCKVFLAKFNE